MQNVLKNAVLAVAIAIIGLIVSFTVHAQTGVIHESANLDAIAHSVGCVDDSALEEFYQADYKNDSAQKKALLADELCFVVLGMKYSLIKNLHRQFSKMPDGTSEVRVYTEGNPKFADYGASIELVVSNKYLRDIVADKKKRYAGYTTIKGLIPFKIWKREEYGTAKISFDVAVPLIDNRLPTKREIGKISRHLVSKERKHKKSFVLFYLPEMQVGSGAFAMAHHNPTMEVEILTSMLWNYPEYKKFVQ